MDNSHARKLLFAPLIPLVLGVCLVGQRGQSPPSGVEIVFTQLPATGGKGQNWERARLARLLPDGSVRALAGDFYSAADPSVSFDGKRILFAGKQKAGERWQVYEMQADGSALRRITQTPWDCRSPIYQPAIFYLDADAPVDQIGFVGYQTTVPSLYSCRLDGSGLRRLTYNPHGDRDPAMLPDGRMLFSSAQRDRVALFGVNIDGTDYAIFSGDEGKRTKRTPQVTRDRLVVFVESIAEKGDEAGTLATVSLLRNLHSYRALTQPSDGLFYSPSGLPNGEILVSWRPANGAGTYGIYRLDPATRRTSLLYDDPKRDDVQASLLEPRATPDGRSSVVDETDPTGKLYCLSAFTSDLAKRDWLPAAAKRLRVLEGLPPELGRRFLGEIDLEEDGSFNIQVPANTPIELQLIDANGMALRSCRWLWVKNKENRGCIGCHEDGELAPENLLAKALTKPSVPLTLPPEKRRTVSFQRDVKPILAQKCGIKGCHGGATPPRVDTAVLNKMPPIGSKPLTEDEKRTIVEWIDLGAQR
jgi:hypothetical protein